MEEKEKEYVREIAWEILKELEYPSRLTDVEVNVDESLSGLRGDIDELRETLSDISLRLEEIERDINGIKESFMYDNLLDLSSVFNKRLAEINAGIKTILERM